MNENKSIGRILGGIASVVVAVLVCAVLCWLGMVIFDAYGVGGLSFACVLIIAAALVDKN